MNRMKKGITIGCLAVIIIVAGLFFIPTQIYAELAVAGVYQYEDLTMENLSVTAESLLGFTYQVKEYELTNVDLNGALNTAHLKKLYLECDFEVAPIMLESIQTRYEADVVYAGENFENTSVSVDFVYTDGTSKNHETFYVQNNPSYVMGEDYTVAPMVDDLTLEAELSIPVIPIVEVEPQAEYGWFADDEVEPIAYHMVYADGKTLDIKGEEAQVVSEDKVILDGDNTFEISYHDLTYNIAFVGVQKILVEAKALEKEQFYIDAPIPNDQFAFELHFEDNTVLELGMDDKRITVYDSERLLDFGDNSFHAAFKDQEFDFTVNAVEKDIENIEPLQYEAYIDEPIALTSIRVNYTDGTSIEKTDFTTNSTEILDRGSNTCQVSYHDNDYTINVDANSYRPIVAASVYVPSDTMEGDVFSFSEVTVTYDNETTKTVAIDQIEVLSDLTLIQGENEIHFRYQEQEVAFTVKAYPRTASRLARRTYATDYANSVYNYCSDNIFVTINKANSAYGVYYLTHVVVSNPNCIRGGMSNDSFGGSREKSTHAASRLNWIVGTNGSYFNTSGGTPALAGVYIKNGSVVSGSRTNGYEICLTSDGTLYSPGAGVSAQTLIGQGVVQTFGTYLPILINGGVKQSDGTDGYLWPEDVPNTGMSQRFDVIYPRTVYGMVKPCEYYILTSGEKSYKNGTTLAEARDILYAKGCTYARPMDGGGSASLVFKGKLVNLPAPSGKERSVADYLYFAE